MRFLNSIKMLALVFLAANALLATTGAYAQSGGTVRFKVAKAGFIVGVGGGTGTLTFKGRTYPLRVDGIGAGTIGVSGGDLVGTASNLRTAADIVGTYSVAGAGLAVVRGVRVLTLQNSNGVILRLQGRQGGFEASLGISGVTITMQ